MAKSRRKSGGCTRGRFKLKKMGKGWSTARRTPQPPPAKAKDKKDGENAG